jgi:hypothetical protein
MRLTWEQRQERWAHQAAASAEGRVCWRIEGITKVVPVDGETYERPVAAFALMRTRGLPADILGRYVARVCGVHPRYNTFHAHHEFSPVGSLVCWVGNGVRNFRGAHEVFSLPRRSSYLEPAAWARR